MKNTFKKVITEGLEEFALSNIKTYLSSLGTLDKAHRIDIL